SVEATRLSVNPDVLLFFDLKEQDGIWRDPRNNQEVIRRRRIDEGLVERIEMCTTYLVKYLKMRQMCLLVGQYRHLNLFDPTEEHLEVFMTGDITLGSAASHAKAVIQSADMRGHGISGWNPFLRRRLHLWFLIEPLPINLDD